MHQTFFDFWTNARSSDDRVPESRFEPRNLISLLPNIVKIRAEKTGPRFSVVGTNIAEEYQVDFTGKLVKEHPYPICREIYLSLIDRMTLQPGFKICYGYFCYNDRHYLRTMEAAFPLQSDTGEPSGYLVLVTVDHTAYKNKLYLPEMPLNVASEEVDIATQDDLNRAIEQYQAMSI